MNEDQHSTEIVQEIDTALKALPALRAPAGLSVRVMAKIRARELPWHRQAWIAWPMIARSAMLTVLTGLFASICLATYKMPGLPALQNFKSEVGSGFSSVSAVWQAAATILAAIPSVVKTIPTVWLATLAAAAALGYLACIGLGTLYFRVAFSERR